MLGFSAFIKFVFPASTLCASSVGAIYLMIYKKELIANNVNDYFVVRVLRKWTVADDPSLSEAVDLYDGDAEEEENKKFSCEYVNQEKWTKQKDDNCEFFSIGALMKKTPINKEEPDSWNETTAPWKYELDADVPNQSSDYDFGGIDSKNQYGLDTINRELMPITSIKHVHSNFWYLMKIDKVVFPYLAKNNVFNVFTKGRNKKNLFEVIVKAPLFLKPESFIFPKQIESKFALISRKRSTDAALTDDFTENDSFECKLKDNIFYKCDLYFFGKKDKSPVTPSTARKDSKKLLCNDANVTNNITPATSTEGTTTKTIKPEIKQLVPLRTRCNDRKELPIEEEREKIMDEKVTLDNFKLKNLEKVIKKAHFKKDTGAPETYYYVVNLLTEYTPFSFGDTLEIRKKVSLSLEKASETPPPSTHLFNTQIVSGILGNINKEDKKDTQFLILTSGDESMLEDPEEAVVVASKETDEDDE